MRTRSRSKLGCLSHVSVAAAALAVLAGAPVQGQVCGNSVVETGEACDPAGSTCTNGQLCTANCNCYSAADCTDSLTLGTSSLFDFVNGFTFTPSSIPVGTFHTIFVPRKPAGTPANLEFDFTQPGGGLFGWVSNQSQLRGFNPTSASQVYVTATLGGGQDGNCDGTSATACANASVPMQSCNASYGRFFQIDSDRDSMFDDMDVVFIDGTAVPLNFRILFVPTLWTGTQAQFDTAAQSQVNLFTNSTNLSACVGTVEVVILNVNTQNFNTFTCTPNNCGVGSIPAFVDGLGLGVNSFDLIVALLPNGASPCAPTVGCSNKTDTIWLEQTPVPVLAHEVGHIYSLADEYCSEAAGGDARCAGAGDINFLGTDLGCNPNTGGGCCTCQNPMAPMGAAACSAVCDPSVPPGNYHACCQGNNGAAGGGSRCIMSSRGAGAGAQSFCTRCQQRLNSQTEFACDALPSGGFSSIVAVDLDITTGGEVTFNSAFSGKGRGTRVSPPGNRFRLELNGPSGNLLAEEFDLIQYDQATPNDVFNIRFRAPVDPDFPVDDPPPLRLSVMDRANVVFDGTVFGSPPVADADGPYDAECTSPQGASIELDGSGSSDLDGDMLRFGWSAPGITFDDAASRTPSAQFPLRDTEVTLVVSDGVFSSNPDTSVVTVTDTTPPTFSLSVSPSRLWPPNHQLIPIAVTVEATDVCDTNPHIRLLSITSDEPDDARGSGNTGPDVQGADFGTDDRRFLLRAERSGQGDGRVYTITYEAEDGSGNVTMRSVTVVVPHSQS